MLAQSSLAFPRGSLGHGSVRHPERTSLFIPDVVSRGFETRFSQSCGPKIHASHNLLFSDFADLGPSVRRIVGAMWPQSPAQALSHPQHSFNLDTFHHLSSMNLGPFLKDLLR